MKKILLFIILCISLISFSFQSRSTVTGRIIAGTALPGTCQPGGSNIYYRTDLGQLFVCTATNTFTAVVTGGAGGNGAPLIRAAGRVTAQSAANASIATFTVGASDSSFEVSGNMNVTASTTLATTLTCTYTDESNTARSMIFPIQQLSGSFIAAGAITAVGTWESPVMHIRCKAATAITILTSTGTFTGVTYTAEGIIKQTA